MDDLPKTIINTINGRSSTVNHSEKDNINFAQSESVNVYTFIMKQFVWRYLYATTNFDALPTGHDLS